jgi:hypothetical protein
MLVHIQPVRVMIYASSHNLRAMFLPRGVRSNVLGWCKIKFRGCCSDPARVLSAIFSRHD